MNLKKFKLIFVILSLVLASCASHVAVHPEPINIQSVIEPGDTVIVVTKDDQEVEFVVVEVTDESIVGENEKVLFTDITKLEEETVSAGENFLIITVITLGAAAQGAASGAAGAVGGMK